MKGTLGHAAQTGAGVLSAAMLARVGVPALVMLTGFAVFALVLICWILSSADRSERVARIMRAWRGNSRCLAMAPTLVTRPESR